MPAGFPILTLAPIPGFPIVTPEELEAFQVDLCRACISLRSVQGRSVTAWTRTVYKNLFAGELVDCCDLVVMLDAEVDDLGACQDAVRQHLQDQLGVRWGTLQFTGQMCPKGYLADCHYRAMQPEFLDLSPSSSSAEERRPDTTEAAGSAPASRTMVLEADVG